MKKRIAYIVITLFTLVCLGVVVVWKSVVHVQLPHGAVLHVLPALGISPARGAVVICPGGGYRYLEKWKEGYWWFPFFYTHGYAVAWLEYRMPNGNCQNPLTDGSDAIVLMRKNAGEWHFNANNVGVVGFSAGGHLASTLLVADSDAVRPDFGILFYPVISMKRELTHQGSHDQLLGMDASEELEAQYSNELHVSEKTPPVFIAVSSDDEKVNPQNSISFREAMFAKNRPATLHVYPSGGHGWGYQLSFEHHGWMLDDLAHWLYNQPNQPNLQLDKQ